MPIQIPTIEFPKTCRQKSTTNLITGDDHESRIQYTNNVSLVQRCKHSVVISHQESLHFRCYMLLKDVNADIILQH